MDTEGDCQADVVPMAGLALGRGYDAPHIVGKTGAIGFFIVFHLLAVDQTGVGRGQLMGGATKKGKDPAPVNSSPGFTVLPMF